MAKKIDITISVEAGNIKEAKTILATALQDGEYQLEKRDGSLFLCVTRDEAISTLVDQTRNATLSDIEKLAAEYDIPLTKKKYRKPGDFPDPSLDHRAEFNRLGKKLNTRVDPEVMEEIKRAAAKAKVTQTDWVTDAILTKLRLEKK